MIAECMYRLTFSGDEMDALYEVCTSALEACLLEGPAKGFAAAIVESYDEAAEDAEDYEPRAQEMLQ